MSILVDTVLTAADLTGCYVHGISAWKLHLEGAKQQNLVISRNLWLEDKEPEITVDNIEVAQFIYLLLHNEKIRDVIDTITSKAVLILGRFTDERKAVLDALRENCASVTTYRSCSTSAVPQRGTLPKLSHCWPAWHVSLWPTSRMPRASLKNSP